MSEICIYTNNLKLFYRIVKKFKEECICFNALDSFDDLHPSTRVLITTQSDLDRFDPEISPNVDILIFSPSQSNDEILLRVQQHLNGVSNFRKITIAVDPGTKKTGVALFLDEKYIYSKEVYDLHHLSQFIQIAFYTFPNPEKIIKIGNGYRYLTRKFLNVLLSPEISQNDIKYLLVDEYFTSKSLYQIRDDSLTSHQRAALLIGRREGQLLTADSIH